MLSFAVSCGAFILVFAITKRLLVAVGFAALAFVGVIALAGFQYERDQAKDREQRGEAIASVPTRFTGTWSGDLGEEKDPLKVLLSVGRGAPGDQVAVVRITSSTSECVATGAVEKSFERRVLLDFERMKGARQCGDLQLDLTGDKNRISATVGRRSSGELSRTKTVTHDTPVTAVVGTWAGTYECSGKPTGLKLTVHQDEDGGLESLFESTPVPGNPHRPYSSFKQSGLLHNGHLTLNPEYWKEEPEGGGYVTVAISADVTEAEPSTIKGDILARGCTTFTLRRQ